LAEERADQQLLKGRIDRARLIESDGASTAAVIGIDELYAVGQIARNNRRMAVALCRMELL
jgi:hypothetical protein